MFSSYHLQVNHPTERVDVTKRQKSQAFGLICLVLLLVLRKPIMRSLKTAARGWRQDPIKMATRIIVAFIAGQGALWILGHDQIGFAMKPILRVGPGRRISRGFFKRFVPKSHRAAVGLKAIEVIFDASRIPTEGALYLAKGFVPDGVATAFTSPLWQFYEVVEKLLGVLTHPERVDEAELSLANIYGNLVRFVAIWAYWKWADDIYLVIGTPIEEALRRRFSPGV